MKKFDNYRKNLDVLRRSDQQDLNNEFIISGIIDIQQVNSRTSDEIQIVNSTIFELPEDDPVVRELRPIIKPEPNKQVNRDSAFGVFVGYSLGLDKSKYTAQEYRDMIEKKMDADILYYAPQIRDRINKMGLQNRSFYIYVLPLDDAEEDKKSIMKKIMREGDA